LQQYPSTQFPDAHWLGAVHAVPFTFAHVPTEPVALHAMPAVVHA
jgi:hypothetical protein